MLTSFTAGDILTRPHQLQVPLDHADPEGPAIEVFAREVVDVRKDAEDLPWLLYLQGGPGFESPRPEHRGGWMGRALTTHRVLLLDQRGTGHSTPVTHQTLAPMTPDAQLAYLKHFRADAIVRDAEALRRALGVERWSLLGQSFGGFLALTYLSFFPESLHHAYITGGVPPLTRGADDIYQATYRRVRLKNEAFFARYPHAQAMCRRIADHLHAHDVRLPNGQRFTPEQFQQVGIHLGRSDAGPALVYMLENAFVSVDGAPKLRHSFLRAMLAEQSHQDNPIYALLHEAIYCQGEASRWSAHRVREAHPEFEDAPGRPFRFTGEMVYPWMFEQYKCLSPMREAAMALAEIDDWPALYDPERLAQNTVPTTCAVYVEDMYVEMAYSLETLAAIPNARPWVTNEYEHNGLRMDGDRILGRLMEMAEEIERHEGGRPALSAAPWSG